MEEKKEVKVKLSTLFLLFIICALIVALGIVYYLGFVKDQKQENNNQTNNVSAINETKESDNKNGVNDVTNEDKKSDNKLNKDDLVTTAYHHVYDTSEGSSVTVDIPKINLEFDNIKKLNKEMYDELYIDENSEMYLIHNIEYKFYLNGNILSIVISQETESDENNYYVYNIDVLTGNSIANDEIIRIKGMTSSEYEEKLREICENTFKARFSNLYAYDETILNNTIVFWNRNTPMFLDDDNTINVIAKYYTDIGSGYVVDILDTQI